MNSIEVIILVVRILGGTFAGVFLFVSLLLFTIPPEGEESETPAIAYIPFLDLLWAIAAPIIYWKENASGRKYMYCFGISLMIVAATFLIK
jgi:hypothetical protein